MSSSEQDDAHDEHNEDEHDSDDARMDNLDVDDHGFVDMHDLAPLVTRIVGLET